MNIRNRVALLGAVAMASAIGFAAPASAQATRTWVSGVGDDVNPCSRTAPCKTFAGAISKTAAGGEINCLDPGGFGAVTIIKSMTIDCHYTEGGALAGGNGVVVNLPASTDVVFLRGLDIFGVNPPTNGVRFIQQGTLFIQDCVIRRFNAANSFGVSYQPTGASELYINNTTIADNGNAATGGGILIQPTGAGSTKALLRDVRVLNNANNGIFVNSQANPASFQQVVIQESDIAGNTNGVNVLAPAAGTANLVLTLINSRSVNNSSTGLIANGATSWLVGESTIAGNVQGVTITGIATINSYGNNHLNGNSTDGAFTAPVILMK